MSDRQHLIGQMLHYFDGGVGAIHPKIVGQLVDAQLPTVVDIIDNFLSRVYHHPAGPD